MLNIEKAKFAIVFFVLCVVIVISILSKFSFLLPIQIVVFLMLLLIITYLLNSYKFQINSYVLISILLLICCMVSYINADFKVNVRDNLIVLITALIAGFNFSFLPIEFKKKVLYVPIFISLWLSMILFSKFITNPHDFFVYDNFYDLMSLNINSIAGFLVLIYPLFFIFIKEKQNHKIFISMMIFVLFAIFLTKCRIAIFSSYVLTIIVLIEYRKYKYIKALIGLMGILLVGFIVYVFMLKNVNNNINEKIIWWKTAILIFKENIFFGCGLGNYTVLFKVFRPQLALNTLFAHNIFFQLLSDIGICGLISFIAFIISFYINMINKIIEDKNKFFYISTALSVTFFLIVNLFDYSFFVPANMLIFFVIFSSAFNFNFNSLKKRRVNVYFLIICYTILAIFIAKPVVAQIYYKKGIQFYIAKQYKIAIEEFEKAIEFDKKNPEYYAQVSKSYFALYDKTRDESAQLYANKSIEYNKKAIELYKNSAALRSSLALIYWNVGENEEALNTIQEAIKYDKYNPYYEEYYYKIKNS